MSLLAERGTADLLDHVFVTNAAYQREPLAGCCSPNDVQVLRCVADSNQSSGDDARDETDGGDSKNVAPMSGDVRRYDHRES